MKTGKHTLNKNGTYIIAELSANHNGNLQNALHKKYYFQKIDEKSVNGKDIVCM